MIKKATYFLFLTAALGFFWYLVLESIRVPESAPLPEKTDSRPKTLLPPQNHSELHDDSFTAFAPLLAASERPDSLTDDSDPEASDKAASNSDAHALQEKFGSREEMFEARDAQNEVVEELGLMETKDGFKNYMEESFEQEPVDSEWAYNYEGLLYEVFANDGVLSGKPIQAIECRSVRCRVQIQLRSTEDVEDVTQTLVGKLVQGAEGLNYATFWGTYSTEDNIGTWYIGRDREVDILQADKAN